MTDLQRLIDMMGRDPESDIGAAMIVDELMDTKGMLRSEADRHVARLRADCRAAKQIDRVAAILAARGERWQMLALEIRIITELEDNESFTICLVGGNNPPSCGIRDLYRQASATLPPLAVMVPAGWALRWWAARGMSTEPPARKRRR